MELLDGIAGAWGRAQPGRHRSRCRRKPALVGISASRGLATVDLALAGALGIHWDCPAAVLDGQ
jgi:hypothetical protein